LTQKESKIYKYWKEKENKLGERILGKNICEYISGYRDFDRKTWGILYFTKNSFYFDIFHEKKFFFSSIFKVNRTDQDKKINTFQIPWKDVIKIDLPKAKNYFLSIFFPPDSLTIVSYSDKSNYRDCKLVLNIHSKNERDRFMEAFQNYRIRSNQSKEINLY